MSTESPIDALHREVDRVKKVVESNKEDDIKGDSTVATNSDMTLATNKTNKEVQHGSENDTPAVVEVPTIMQTDDSFMVLGDIESPNKTLHGIISHNVNSKLKDVDNIENAEVVNTENEDHTVKMHTYFLALEKP